MARIAEQLGFSLMDWQQRVADVLLELLPGTRIPAYREGIVTVPRQMGKTTLVLALELQRCLRWPAQPRVAYSAQTGTDARRKLLDDQVPLLQRSPMWAAVKSVHRAGGREAITFKNGSRIDVFAGLKPQATAARSTSPCSTRRSTTPMIGVSKRCSRPCRRALPHSC